MYLRNMFAKIKKVALLLKIAAVFLLSRRFEFNYQLGLGGAEPNQDHWSLALVLKKLLTDHHDDNNFKKQ